MRQSAVMKAMLRGTIALAPMLVLWQVTSLLVEPFFWPNIATVVAELAKLLDPAALMPHTLTSLSEFLIGYITAAIVGVALGVALARSTVVRLTLGTLVSCLAVTPLAALAPLMGVWFGGAGIAGEATLAFIAAVFPIACAITEKAKEPLSNSQPRSAAPARSLDVGRAIVGGLRIGVPPALVAVVICEMVASGHGLGYLMLNAAVRLNVAMVVSTFIAIAVPGVVLTRILAAIEGRLWSW